ncbi:MAG TPA: type II toxin-antitoxin system ParD family antitoxin [Polyangiales bacterium]
MPTRNVNLTEELDSFIAAKVASGKYENASEVVRAGLRVLGEQEEARQVWLAYARKEAGAAFAALDRGEGVTTTANELVARLDGKVRSHARKRP